MQSPSPWALCGCLAIAACAGPATESPKGEALVAHAQSIHERVLTLDTHKDIPDELAPESLPSDPETRERFRKRFDPTVRGEAQVDFPKMREGFYDAAFFIVYVGQGDLDEAGYRRAHAAAMRKFDAIHRMARLHPDIIEIARTPDDVERLVSEGKLVACIGIENGYPMGTDLANIEAFYDLGARYMSLAHNRHSQLGDSHTPDEPLHGGLTELGAQAIAEMNRLGIMVDISHSSRATMMQAVAASKAPVLASHSGCRSVCDHTRNLDDEQLRALAANGGVLQCVALGSFVKDAVLRNEVIASTREELGLPRSRWSRDPVEDFEAKVAKFEERMKVIDRDYPPATVADFVDHIDHAVSVMGIEHVAISSDFDGGGGIVGWNDASETSQVTLEMVRRGYTEEQIAKIWSGNTLRVWREVEAVARQLQAARD